MTGQSKITKKKPAKSSTEEGGPGTALKSILTLRNAGIAFVFLVTLVFISPSPRLSRVGLKEGKPTRKLILAGIDFEVIDEEATRLARERAVSLVPPVYVFDPELVLAAIRNAEEQFEKIQQDVLNPLFTKEERIALLSKYLVSSTSEGTLQLLADLDSEKFTMLRAASLEVIESVLNEGILSDLPGSARNISVYDQTSYSWRLMEVSDVLTLKKAPEALTVAAASKFPDSIAFQNALVELSLASMSNTLRFDETLTENTKAEAGESTPPVTRIIRKDEVIVEAGHKVTRQDLLELHAHALALSRANRVNLQAYLGNAMLLAIVLGCFLFYLRRFRPEILKSNKSLLLVGIMLLATLGTGWVLILLPIASVWLYLVPVAAGAILLSVLADDRMALVYSFFISVLYAAQGNYRLNFLLVGVFGSLAGIYYIRTIRRRSDVMRPGIAVAIVNVITVVTLFLIGNLQEDFVAVLIAGAGNGLITAIGVVPALTFLESLLGIVTNIRLLELSDLNHPLLKQMAMQAPGSYHHCLMVGNLAEAAAEEIGANSLLARVGSYFHDVGKMTKPQYFSENQRGGKNRHDELTPNMSALILTAHEKEGIELAREHRLNQPIIDFIEQHHGTSLMPFFYQKALEQSSGEDVNEETFRYPGPRPQSREIAICMLADSVEAASRTLSNPTHGRIKTLVQKIVNNKYIDSQLDECDLTLKDIHVIADSFVRVLAGYLHSRVEYPEEQTAPEIKEKFESTDTKHGAKAANKTRANPKSN